MNLNELLVFRQTPGVPDVNPKSKSLVCSLQNLPSGQVLHEVQRGQLHAADGVSPSGGAVSRCLCFCGLFPSIQHADELFAFP